jgi:hypothetical protein
MSNFDDWSYGRNLMGSSSGMSTNSQEASGSQELEKRFQKFFASLALSSIVRSIRKRIVGFVRMKGEYIPKENVSFNPIEHIPYDRGRAFGYGCADGRAL